jgi:hypothetical protein
VLYVYHPLSVLRGIDAATAALAVVHSPPLFITMSHDQKVGVTVGTSLNIGVNTVIGMYPGQAGPPAPRISNSVVVLLGPLVNDMHAILHEIDAGPYFL